MPGPSKAHWDPDSSADGCTLPGCVSKFSLFNRRSHCRLCGKIYCSAHCADELKLDELARPTPYGTTSKVCPCCAAVGYATAGNVEEREKYATDTPDATTIEWGTPCGALPPYNGPDALPEILIVSRSPQSTADAAPVPTIWICGVCTLENNITNALCDVCGSARPLGMGPSPLGTTPSSHQAEECFVRALLDHAAGQIDAVAVASTDILAAQGAAGRFEEFERHQGSIQAARGVLQDSATMLGLASEDPDIGVHVKSYLAECAHMAGQVADWADGFEALLLSNVSATAGGTVETAVLATVRAHLGQIEDVVESLYGSEVTEPATNPDEFDAVLVDNDEQVDIDSAVIRLMTKRTQLHIDRSHCEEIQLMTILPDLQVGIDTVDVYMNSILNGFALVGGARDVARVDAFERELFSLLSTFEAFTGDADQEDDMLSGGLQDVRLRFEKLTADMVALRNVFEEFVAKNESNDMVCRPVNRLIGRIMEQQDNAVALDRTIMATFPNWRTALGETATPKTITSISEEVTAAHVMRHDDDLYAL